MNTLAHAAEMLSVALQPDRNIQAGDQCLAYSASKKDVAVFFTCNCVKWENNEQVSVLSNDGDLYARKDCVKVVPYATTGLVPPHPGETSRYVLALNYRSGVSTKTWLWDAPTQRWKSVAKPHGTERDKFRCFSFHPDELFNTVEGGWKIVKKVPMDHFENTGYAQHCIDIGNW